MNAQNKNNKTAREKSKDNNEVFEETLENEEEQQKEHLKKIHNIRSLALLSVIYIIAAALIAFFSTNISGETSFSKLFIKILLPYAFSLLMFGGAVFLQNYTHNTKQYDFLRLRNFVIIGILLFGALILDKTASKDVAFLNDLKGYFFIFACILSVVIFSVIGSVKSNYFIGILSGVLITFATYLIVLFIVFKIFVFLLLFIAKDYGKKYKDYFGMPLEMPWKW